MHWGISLGARQRYAVYPGLHKGGWDPGDAINADNVYLRTGYVIRYAGCPIYWQSKLQMEITLSMAEAEYIALSQALRETR